MVFAKHMTNWVDGKCCVLVCGLSLRNRYDKSEAKIIGIIICPQSSTSTHSRNSAGKLYAVTNDPN